ncbi:MAG: 6-phosphofructokinase [Oscillospiraceae bacterium]|nr:6-phosphofructokinase [Oscillospiraceae bacterium]MBQ8731207.1 6-phosphofructokinase [Oscillospiraceae bacterium]
MESKVKTIGVLTSGGDAPGMNAAVRAVVRSALRKGIRVLGIRRGYNGLMNCDMMEMDERSVSNIINQGGTALYTARCPEFKGEEGIARGVATCKEAGIEGLVVIGGDGSFRGARDLSLAGIPCIGIPGTIDNDIVCTDYTLGYDTALNTAMEAIDKLRDTCQSHDRCSVVEVMGHHCGDIALNIGIACGATAVLLPEKSYDVDADIITRIENTRKTGKKHFIIIVSELMMDVHALAKEIEAKTGIETRATVLGHILRGGAPSVRDRVTATKMGHHAVELLSQGIGNRVVVEENSKITDYDILEGLKMPRKFDEETYQILREVNI